MMKFFLTCVVLGLEKKTKDSYPTAGKINRGRNKTGHKIASKRKEKKEK